MTRDANARVTCERPAEEKIGGAFQALRYIDSPAYDLPADPVARARAVAKMAAERRQHPKLTKMHDDRVARMAWIAVVIADRRRRLENPDARLRRHPELRPALANFIREDRAELAELCGHDPEYLQAWLDYGARIGGARSKPPIQERMCMARLEYEGAMA